jgi:hypothetical protein
MSPAVGVIPRSQLSIGLDPTLRGRLAALARGRALLIDFFTSRRCGVTIGDLTVAFRPAPSAAAYAALAPIEGVPVFVESRLVETLRGSGPTLRLSGPAFARHLGISLDRPELWIDFLDDSRSIRRSRSTARR